MEQKSFDDIKRADACKNLLSYPDFNKHFDIHTDANDCHLGVVINQGGKTIAFYSRKYTGPQTQYTVT